MLTCSEPLGYGIVVSTAENYQRAPCTDSEQASKQALCKGTGTMDTDVLVRGGFQNKQRLPWKKEERALGIENFCGFSSVKKIYSRRQD